MQCACGFQPQTGKPNIDIKTLNQHRSGCSVFWQAIYDDMKRIALTVYGRIAPVSVALWNEFHDPTLPSYEKMKKWCPPWADVQAAAGVGVSSRGKGAILQQVGEVLGVTDSNRRLDDVALSIRPMSTTAENYLAQTYREGLPICEQSYLRTGRMWVR